MIFIWRQLNMSRQRWETFLQGWLFKLKVVIQRPDKMNSCNTTDFVCLHMSVLHACVADAGSFDGPLGTRRASTARDGAHNQRHPFRLNEANKVACAEWLLSLGVLFRGFDFVFAKSHHFTPLGMIRVTWKRNAQMDHRVIFFGFCSCAF